MRFRAFVAAILGLIALIAAGPQIHAAGRSISGIAADESGGLRGCERVHFLGCCCHLSLSSAEASSSSCFPVFVVAFVFFP